MILLVCEVALAGLATAGAARPTLLGLASWEMRGEDEDEPEDWF